VLGETAASDAKVLEAKEEEAKSKLNATAAETPFQRRTLHKHAKGGKSGAIAATA
jgi:hypothetical protein